MKPKLVCANCSSDITSKDKFCASCGTKIEWDDEPKESIPEIAPEEREVSKPAARELTCDVCGEVNESTSQFCESCGARLEGAQPPPKSAKTDKPAAKQKQQRKKRKQQPAPVSSGKVISIAAAVLLLGFAAYIFIIDRDTTHTHDHDRPAGMGGMGGGEMERAIMQEIDRLEHELDHHDPENQEAMIRLANLYHDIRQFDSAIRYYNMYIERNPDNPDVKVDLGICYFEAGQPERAVETVEQVTRDFPNHQLSAFNLGIIYLNLGEVEPANRYFKRAYEINPNNETGQRARRIIDEHTF